MGWVGLGWRGRRSRSWSYDKASCPDSLFVLVRVCSLHAGTRSSRVPGPSPDVPWHVQLAGVLDALSVRAQAAVRDARTADLPLRGLPAVHGEPSAHLHHGRQNSLSAGIINASCRIQEKLLWNF